MANPNFKITATDGRARAGVLSMQRHALDTPTFMPVGTRGSVRTITSQDLEELGADIILGNTYHLMLRPGEDLIEEFGGIHGFADWKRLILTDSGGYQVFSLEPDVDDDGVEFKSTYDGSLHRLTPERAVDIQCSLGADIQMVLDVCPPIPAEKKVLEIAVERTHKWAIRGRNHFLLKEKSLLIRQTDNLFKITFDIISTYMLVLFTWLFFRIDSISNIQLIFYKFANWESSEFSQRIIIILLFYHLISFTIDLVEMKMDSHLYLLSIRNKGIRLGIISGVLLVCFLFMFQVKPNPFIYFQF